MTPSLTKEPLVVHSCSRREESFSLGVWILIGCLFFVDGPHPRTYGQHYLNLMSYLKSKEYDIKFALDCVGKDQGFRGGKLEWNHRIALYTSMRFSKNKLSK